ncbi:MAG TPA: adenosylcobinamide-GDP ribazoletransferase [Desulfopila sp.]|nr:adenosylcobinamide-GDP ribazoletransferase [Desulfopila sp.]
MKSILRSFLAGLRFLTIVPISWQAERDEKFFQKSVSFFPIIGLLIGVAGGAVAVLASDIVPQPLLAAILLLYLGAVSGFLHLDGLADTADGFFSSRPKDQVLTIMRDSRSGAMAITVLSFVLLFKFAALLSIAPHSLAWTVLIMPVAGRSAIVLQMAFLPYARKEGGLGALFYRRSKWVLPSFSLLLVFLLASANSVGLAALLIVTIATIGWLFGLWCLKIIGGTTGDTLGAACELTEAATVAACAIYFNM